MDHERRDPVQLGSPFGGERVSRFDENEGLGPLPTEHPRARVVRSAETKLNRAFIDIAQEFELTTGEELRVLSNMLSSCIGSIAKYAIRHERHGRGDKPGDLE